jgi:hypothetical protein
MARPRKPQPIAKPKPSGLGYDPAMRGRGLNRKTRGLTPDKMASLASQRQANMKETARRAAAPRRRGPMDQIGDFIQDRVDTVMGKKNRLTPEKPRGVIPYTESNIKKIRKAQGR